jgi:hypothetical protein
VNGKPYHPRIGHWDYRANNLKGDEDNRKDLSAYLSIPSPKEIIENWEKYSIK